MNKRKKTSLTFDLIPFTTIPTHQSLRDVASSSQRFEMSAVVNQLHLLQVQSLQHLLTGPVHNMKLFMAVDQDQCTTVDPLQRRKDTKETRT